MDNGNSLLADGTLFGVAGVAACYSTIPVFRIDEIAKTAAFTFRQVLHGGGYSIFGGNLQQLANGHVEYELCGRGLSVPGSQVFEVTQDASAQTVWNMKVSETYVYRASRMGSMYPRV